LSSLESVIKLIIERRALIKNERRYSIDLKKWFQEIQSKNAFMWIIFQIEIKPWTLECAFDEKFYFYSRPRSVLFVKRTLDIIKHNENLELFLEFDRIHSVIKEKSLIFKYKKGIYSNLKVWITHSYMKTRKLISYFYEINLESRAR